MLNIDIQYDTVLNAIYRQLQENYPCYNIYKIFSTYCEYPNFYINQISVTPVPDTKDFWWLNYLFAIEYRDSEDLTTVSNLNEELDKIGFELGEKLWYLEYIKAWIENPSIDKGEGVLSFTFNVRIRVRKERLKVLMQELTINDKEKQTEV